MKLPEGKKERYQILGLIGMVVVLVLVLIVKLAIAPIRASWRKSREALAEQEAKTEKARKELERATVLKVDYDRLTAEIDKILAANVRRPILGQYLVGITETIDDAARQAGVTIEDTQEVGVRELPRSKKTTTPQAFKSLTAQVTGTGSYAQIQAFVRKLEDDNPMLCFTDIRISGQSDKPEAHRMTVRLEWPISAQPESSGDKKGTEP
jgi:Tfp pilus assembly protein PilO